MEEKVNVWKANLTNGLILGFAGVIFTLLQYFTNQTGNKILGVLLWVILIIVLYFLIKSYRDSYKHGMITYGEALGAGVIIFLYYSVIMAVFIYILYKFIDPGLVDKNLAMAEEMLEKRGLPQSAIDTGMAMQKKFMVPGFMAITSIFGNMLFGLVFSLIDAAFVKKEGNPLLDSTENQL